MGLNIEWPIAKKEVNNLGWICYECPPDYFGNRTESFETTEDLDLHRRLKHSKEFDGDVNIKESKLLKMKRKIFDGILNANRNMEEE